ncbi:hypothetical protein CXP47_16145 [Pseudomonas chlororaphis]|nr:hypothetical protein CXP47_16145 [Pseudomonas chlororaphis]
MLLNLLGSAQKVAALGHAALKTGSECSCRSLHSASSPVFALPDLRSPTFWTDPRDSSRGRDALNRRPALSAMPFAALI